MGIGADHAPDTSIPKPCLQDGTYKKGHMQEPDPKSNLHTIFSETISLAAEYASGVRFDFLNRYYGRFPPSFQEESKKKRPKNHIYRGEILVAWCACGTLINQNKKKCDLP